jgi:hypothetical protein
MPTLAEILEAKKREKELQPDGQLPAIITSNSSNSPDVVDVVETSTEVMVLSEEDMMLDEIDSTIFKQATLAAEDIVPRIRQLNSLTEADLPNEMKLLRDALMANPAAVSLMMPEDVGLLVIALRKITQEAVIASASTPSGKSKKVKAVVVTPEMIAAVEDF